MFLKDVWIESFWLKGDLRFIWIKIWKKDEKLILAMQSDFWVVNLKNISIKNKSHVHLNSRILEWHVYESFAWFK